MCAYLYAAIFICRSECIRPSLNQLEHFVSNVFVSGCADELSKSLTVGLIGNLFVNGLSAVLDDALENHQSIESCVGILRDHLLLNLSHCVLRAGS